MKEKIIDEVVSLLINNYGEATEQGRQKIDNNIDLYANDYLLSYVYYHNIKLNPKYISEIIEEIKKEFYKY